MGFYTIKQVIYIAAIYNSISAYSSYCACQILNDFFVPSTVVGAQDAFMNSPHFISRSRVINNQDDIDVSNNT